MQILGVDLPTGMQDKPHKCDMVKLSAHINTRFN